MVGSAFQEGAGYMVFMLRVWQEGSGPGGSWRFDLEDPATRNRRGFSDLDDLVAFLRGLPQRESGAKPAPEPERREVPALRPGGRKRC